MQEVTLSEDELRRRNAKKAAKKAAAYFSSSEPKNKSNGKAALYTWGVLAASCFVAAGSIGVYPELSSTPQMVQLKDSSRIAARSKSLDPVTTVTAVPVDDLLRSSQPTHIEPVEPTKAVQHKNGLDPLPTGSIEDSDRSAAKALQSGTLGVEIGRATSAESLSLRYQAFMRRRSDLFSNIAPMTATLGDGSKMIALIAGPFQTADEVATFCRSMRLQLTIDCKPSPYQGSPLN